MSFPSKKRLLVFLTAFISLLGFLVISLYIDHLQYLEDLEKVSGFLWGLG